MSAPNTSPDQATTDAHRTTVGGTQATGSGQTRFDTQAHTTAPGQTSQTARVLAEPNPVTPSGDQATGSGHCLCDAQQHPAAPGQTSQTAITPAEPISGPPSGNPTTGSGHRASDTHGPHAAPGPILADATLGMCADILDDLESVRDANANRFRSLTTEHGLGVELVDIKRLANLVESLEDSTNQATLNLRRVMRRHPLWPIMKGERGVGEKQLARLLACIRDPYWNDLHDRPRTISELWAYCGLHTVGGAAPTRQRGVQANWNDDARKRVWLIADKIVMCNGGKRREVGTPSKYIGVYDDAREKYSAAVHDRPCPRCGPKGSPAQPGSPLPPAHQHARALRAVCKAILKDLWLEGRRLHINHPDDQVRHDAQDRGVVGVSTSTSGQVSPATHDIVAAGGTQPPEVAA